MDCGRNLKMSKKGTYSIVNHFYDFPELVQRLRQLRTNYDYPIRALNTFVGCWVILETFIESVHTTHGDRMMLIISELSDPNDPESTPTGKRYKVFSSSKRINTFLSGLRASEDELRTLPMTVKIIAVPFKSKTGEIKTRFEIDCGL